MSIDTTLPYLTLPYLYVSYLIARIGNIVRLRENLKKKGLSRTVGS